MNGKLFDMIKKPLAAFLVAALVIGAFLFLYTRADKEETKTEAAKMAADGSFKDEKWKEGRVYYKGKSYTYNTGLRTYLIMGIDNDKPVEKAADSLSGGQSDGMFLLVADQEAKTLRVIAINRNTVTGVDVYDAEGNYQGRMDLVICLQHGYGDGEKLSCTRAVKAVQRLMYNIPISGYFSLNMGGIGALNDAIGGITLTPIEDIDWRAAHLKTGEEHTLNGDEAYAYLRWRNIDEFASSDKRLERQKQYINLFIKKLMSDSSKATAIYNAASDYVVASVDLAQLVSELDDLEYDESEFYTIPGKTEQVGKFEEYHVDEDGLMELLLNVFYKEVPEEGK